MQNRHESDRHESDIDKTLAALRAATPPEGLEARVQQRLRYHRTQTARTAAARWSPTPAWWHGLLSGVAAALLLCGVVFAGLHSHTPDAKGHADPTHATEVSMQRPAAPSNSSEFHCAEPTEQAAPQTPAKPHMLRAALHKPSAAPLSGALTPDERELVRLTHVAAPQQLASLRSDARAQADQQDTAAFNAFFTPPPRPTMDPPAAPNTPETLTNSNAEKE